MAIQMKNTFTLYKDENKEWRWNCIASNGRNIAYGESYKNRKDCMKAIRSLTGKEYIFRIVE